MIGGTVTRTQESRGCVFYCVKDEGGEETVIGVTRTAEARCVSEGDKLQWTTTQVFWTPINAKGERIGEQSNIALTRVGPRRAKMATAVD